jgi:probable HAF family extracellular repeat protein
MQAVIYTNGKLTRLGALPGWSSATAINDSGQIIGATGVTDGSGHAFLYYNGLLDDLGHLGGDWSQANAINASGVVVGQSRLADGTQHAFVWSDKKSGMLDLKTLPGFEHSAASDISDAGLLVGTATGGIQGKSTAGHGFRYSVITGLQDLNEHVDPKAGLVILQALKVNTAGEILVYGLQNDVPGYFLLALKTRV